MRTVSTAKPYRNTQTQWGNARVTAAQDAKSTGKRIGQICIKLNEK